MVFSESTFLFVFLPVFLLAYMLFKVENATLLVASLLFYAIGEGYFVFLLLALIGINYVLGLGIASTQAFARSVVLGLGIVINLGALIYYKYAHFLITDVLGIHWRLTEGIRLPLGISFIAFHSISYLIDIYRGDAAVERSPIRLAVYITMFPQLVAGPIVRFHLVGKQLAERVTTLPGIYYGSLFFAVGLAQKALVADPCGALADEIYAQPVIHLTQGAIWLGAVAYMSQIYFDFSGYSTMAIGLAYALGFTFPKNFNYPYASKSITEFWRRWHMTLSNWFRDYFYKPIGGSWTGSAATYRNLLLVFILCGLWHGAAWTFLVWGLFHGVLLVVERVGLADRLAKGPALIAHVYVVLSVLVGWVFFRDETLAGALSRIEAMFLGSAGQNGIPIYLTNETMLVLVLSFVLATPLVERTAQRFMAVPTMAPWPNDLPRAHYLTGGAVAMILLLLSSMKVLSGSYSPFIYFRF